MTNYEIYAQQIKPAFAPQGEIFGTVWSILYIIIFITFGYVMHLFIKQKIDFRTLLPFVLNLLFNAMFTPIQFGLQDNLLALVDIVLVFGTIIWAMKTIKPINKYIAYAQIPYLAWVSFATILQASITYLNW